MALEVLLNKLVFNYFDQVFCRFPPMPLRQSHSVLRKLKQISKIFSKYTIADSTVEIKSICYTDGHIH